MKSTTISRTAFQDLLSRYSATVPGKLQELDTLRYVTIPDVLAGRKEVGDAQLEKSEVEKLVEWKLKHGTFRPKLLQLVQSNPEHVIQNTTLNAFKLVSANAADPSQPLKVLTQLKGIGPATASLLLSAFAPDSIPFFSDELFRWCMWDEPGSPTGWKRVIKYNAKEYAQLVEKVKQITEKLKVSAVDMEKVAWVLGKEGVDLDAGNDEIEGNNQQLKANGVREEEKTSEEELTKKGPNKNAKRKAADAEVPISGLRRSIRRKA